MSKRKGYVLNAFWLYLDSFLSIGISFITGLAVARYLGPEKMGIWGYSLSLSSMLAIFGTLGIQQIAIRDLVREQTERQTILGSIIGMRLIGSGTIWLILFCFGLASNDINVRWLLILLGGTYLFQAFDTYDFLFQAEVQSRYGVIVRIVFQFILGGAKMALIYINAPLVWFGVAALMAAVIQSGLYISLGWIITGIGPFQWRFNFSKAWYFLVQSWPLIISGLATTIYLQIDNVMLKHISGNEMVGHFSVASRVAVALTFVTSVFCQAFYPAILRAREVSVDFYKSRLVRLYSVTIWIAVLLGIILAASANWIIPLLLGPKYAPSIPILQVLSIIGVFTPITLVSSYWLMAENLQQFSLYRNLFGMVVNIVLNLYLIPRFGGVGAAVASVVSRGMGSIGFMLFAPRLRCQLSLIVQALNPVIIYNSRHLLRFGKGECQWEKN